MVIPGVLRAEARTLPRASGVAVAAIAIACLPLIFRLPWNFLWLRHCSDGAAAQKELAG